MGTIYKVHHNLLDEVRVIKFMRAAVTDNPDVHRRFLQEAKLVTRFKHPNIAAVYDFALDDEGTAYIVMEYVPGLNLRDAADALGTLSLPLVLEIAAQTLDALGYLHRKSVVHRDISPDNIMAVAEDGAIHVKLIDLGIAKALDETDGVTRTGLFLGKLKYASPEQLGALDADERMDGRSDIYSLGVVLYELLTGRQPFTGSNAQSLIAAQLCDPPLDFDLADPDGRIPGGVRALVLRALAKNRAERFATAESMRDTIRDLLRDIPTATLAADVEQWAAAQAREQASEPVQPSTPGAQERVDRRFGMARQTPSPTSAPLSSGPTLASTVEARSRPAPGADPTVVDEAVNVPAARASRSRLPWMISATAAIAAVVLALFVWLDREPAPPERKADVPRIESEQSETLATVPQSSTIEITDATATAVESDRVATATIAEPRAVVPASIRPAPQRQNRVSPPPQARREEVAPQQEPARAEPISQPPAEPQPIRVEVPEVVRTETVAPRTTDTPERAEAPTAEDGVRAALAEFVAAQEALDAGRYVAIFPSATESRIAAAFRSFRSQELTLTIDEVTIDGNRATVRAQEQRTATPKVGSVQRVNAARTFALERRGGRWIVSSIR